MDDYGGMLFNRRRQSRDSVLNSRIIELACGNRLLMSGYSAKMFGENPLITVDEDYMKNAKQGELCFAEKKPETLAGVETLYIFSWNRHYPADVFFEFDPEKEGFYAASAEEFAGSSHEKITLTVYERR